MTFRSHPPSTAARRTVAALARLAVCALLGGCAGPAWADYETQRAVEEAAADTSFPSAAEAGLAGGNTVSVAANPPE